MIKEAVVLCGGRGQRLRPYTDHIPKPMLKIAGKPVLEYVIANLKRNKVEKAYFAVGYLGEKIEEYFGDGKKFGIEIEYKYEKTPLNTAGAVAQFKNDIEGDDFYILAADHLTSWNLMGMAEKHREKKAIVTIGFVEKKSVLDYGVGKIENGFVKDFVEKPMETYLINTGIYVANSSLFYYLKVGEDLSKNVFPKLLKSKEKIAAFVDDSEFWMDIGRVKDYERVNDLLSITSLEGKLFYNQR